MSTNSDTALREDAPTHRLPDAEALDGDCLLGDLLHDAEVPLLAEPPDDDLLLDLELDDLLDLDLPNELPDDLLALTLLAELLLSDFLISAPDNDLLDDLAAADLLEDKPLDLLFDDSSARLGEEAALDPTP